MSHTFSSPSSESSKLSLWERLEAELTALEPQIIAMRRHLHRHPELSTLEFSTTEYLAQRLDAEQVPYRLATGIRGVLVDLGPADSGPRLALRADCDALPIQEENQIEYASENPGVMHACGHDAHTAMLFGALLALHRARCPWPVRGIFQPAEEAGDGALGMISEGALDGVKAILALHVDPNLPLGQVAAVPGPQSASCQDFRILVQGRGGHAARPHLCIDPVEISASLITQIYQAVPRQLNPQKPVVLSICQIHAGSASNVIPDSAELTGTIRSLDSGAAGEARESLERVCRDVATASGAVITPDFDRAIPGMVNDEALTSACTEAAREVLGAKSVIVSSPASMGAEDFADYQQQIPGCMMRLGVKREGFQVTPLHTPTFDIDENALLLGSKLLLRSLFQLNAANRRP